VQNVAVEEQTFFDVTADPGFRKYITGEVWLAGELNREHLINIDRSTFNRECADYRAVRRFMSRTILDFKSKNVQRPQRLKVAVRRRIESHRRLIEKTQRVIDRAVELVGLPTLPSSETSMRIRGKRDGLAGLLSEFGAEVTTNPSHDGSPSELAVTPDGGSIIVSAKPNLINSTVRCGETSYAVVFACGSRDAPCVIVRNRPRQIVFNRSHAAFNRDQQDTQLSTAFALELAYLLTRQADPADLYSMMASFIDAM
jgi:hypothetical protein